MKRKILSAVLLLLAAALALTFLTSCGKQDESEAEAEAPLPTADAPGNEAPTPTNDWQAMSALTAIKEYYSGYWYGVFHLYDGTGEYITYDDDAVAYFDFDAGVGNGAMAHVTVTGISDGRILADFMAQIDEEDSWSVDGAEVFGAFASTVSHEFFEDSESMLILSGEAEDEEGAFSFSIHIRPWGMTWDDVAEEYPDEMPANYEDWYLPMLESEAP